MATSQLPARCGRVWERNDQTWTRRQVCCDVGHTLNQRNQKSSWENINKWERGCKKNNGPQCIVLQFQHLTEIKYFLLEWWIFFNLRLTSKTHHCNIVVITKFLFYYTSQMVWYSIYLNDTHEINVSLALRTRQEKKQNRITHISHSLSHL